MASGIVGIKIVILFNTDPDYRKVPQLVRIERHRGHILSKEQNFLREILKSNQSIVCNIEYHHWLLAGAEGISS